MTETLFNPPHNATETEFQALFPHWSEQEFRAFKERQGMDSRLTSIWNLYRIRGDEAGEHVGTVTSLILGAGA